MDSSGQKESGKQEAEETSIVPVNIDEDTLVSHIVKLVKQDGLCLQFAVSRVLAIEGKPFEYVLAPPGDNILHKVRAILASPEKPRKTEEEWRRLAFKYAQEEHEDDEERLTDQVCDLLRDDGCPSPFELAKLVSHDYLHEKKERLWKTVLEARRQEEVKKNKRQREEELENANKTLKKAAEDDAKTEENAKAPAAGSGSSSEWKAKAKRKTTPRSRRMPSRRRLQTWIISARASAFKAESLRNISNSTTSSGQT